MYEIVTNFYLWFKCYVSRDVTKKCTKYINVNNQYNSSQSGTGYQNNYPVQILSGGKCREVVLDKEFDVFDVRTGVTCDWLFRSACVAHQDQRRSLIHQSAQIARPLPSARPITSL